MRLTNAIASAKSASFHSRTIKDPSRCRSDDASLVCISLSGRGAMSDRLPRFAVVLPPRDHELLCATARGLAGMGDDLAGGDECDAERDASRECQRERFAPVGVLEDQTGESSSDQATDVASDRDAGRGEAKQEVYADEHAQAALHDGDVA